MPDLDPAAPNPQMSKGKASGSETPDEQFVVQFWGVRGKIAAPGKETMRYGGNTSCVEMRLGEKRLIFDGGTGLRVLGNSLLRQMPVEAHIFFSHSYLEGIQGFPFFVPAFIRGNSFHIYGTGPCDDASIKHTLSGQMLPPNFPVPIQVMQSELKFYHLTPGDIMTIGDITIETCLINSFNQGIGYRVAWQGHVAVYATGTKRALETLDKNLIHLAREADVLICDATSTQAGGYEPQSSPLSWQDAPWEPCLSVAKAAEVKQLVMTRHDPDHTDDLLDRIEQQIQSVFPESLLAREGMVIQVGH